jgi:hydroxymethylpyrimidine/phosphomethylpyrimidine kinase
MIKTILTIAGSDSSAGAGIQADLKTIAAHGCYGASVITTITAQNTMGVQELLAIPPSMIEAQAIAVIEDLDVSVIKIGMLSTSESIMIVAKLLEQVEIKAVLDPIIATSDKTELLQKEAIELLKEQLFPKVFLLTPNIPEAELLTGMKIENVADMKAACKEIWAENILLKGGHLEGNILVDVLYHDGEFYEFKHRKISSQNTHGTGCTLSSAIASNLACEMDLPTACDAAINYVAKAIIESYPTGKGSGSLNHCFVVKKDG